MVPLACCAVLTWASVLTKLNDIIAIDVVKVMSHENSLFGRTDDPVLVTVKKKKKKKNAKLATTRNYYSYYLLELCMYSSKSWLSSDFGSINSS